MPKRHKNARKGRTLQSLDPSVSRANSSTTCWSFADSEPEILLKIVLRIEYKMEKTARQTMRPASLPFLVNLRSLLMPTGR